MELKFKKRLLIVSLFSFISINLFSLNVPSLQGRVNDYANIINQETKNQLASYLNAFEQQTGMQLVVLTIPSLQDEELSSFSIKVAEEWKIGRKGKDDGALLLVAYEERMIRIEVGYGLEGKLTDSICGRIIRNVIIPEFKIGNYSEGIYKGIQNIGGIISDDATIVSTQVLEDSEENGSEGIFSLIFMLIFFFLIVSSKGGILKWIFLSSLLNNNSRRTNFSNISSVNKSSSSFSSMNHFSGGGGHFGGGGASGRW